MKARGHLADVITKLFSVLLMILQKCQESFLCPAKAKFSFHHLLKAVTQGNSAPSFNLISDFTLFKAEKERLAVAELTGIATAME